MIATRRMSAWGRCALSLVSVACLVACSSSHDNGGGVATGTKPGQSPAGAKAPSGSCKAGAKKACTGTKCADGAFPEATCSSAGDYGACVCAKAATASKDGGMGSAGSGAHPSSGGVWAMMGYDTHNNYFNPNEKTLTVDNAKSLKEKWRFMVAGYPPGSPVVAEGKVFVMATGGTYAINLDDGKQAWARMDITGTASLAYADGFVYAHTSSGANLYKLNASDGKTVWGPFRTYELASCDGTSSPIVAGGLVLVGHSCGVPEVSGGADQAAARGGVEAFKIDDGTHAWTYYTVPETGENGAMVWSTVSVDEEAGVVFAGTGNNYTMLGDHSDSIHAINLADGTRKWAQQVRKGDIWTLQMGIGNGQDTDFGANPILAELDGKKVVADGDKGSAFWVLDRETGEILWSRDALSSSHNAQNGGVLMNGAFDGTYFYVVSNQPPGAALLHALDPAKKGADAWPPKMFSTVVFGAPSVANGVLVVPAGSALNIYNAKTGDMLNTFETGGTIAAGAAAIVDGNVIVQSGLSYPFEPTAKNNNLVICYGL
jgi:outer membrane protein assembly factor BamB